MTTPPPVLEAAIRAIHGEPNLSAVMPAINDRSLAPVIALAPGAHRLVRDVATIFGRLFELIDKSTIADPAINDVMNQIIGTLEKQGKIYSWATISWSTIAPPGWGRAYADALVRAVNNDTCDAVVAASLIGPVDASTSLLSKPPDIAFAIHHWGSSNPNAPTAWMRTISAGEQKRLIDSVQGNSFAAAMCLPWLPPDTVHQVRIKDDDLAVALRVFAEASPTAREQHAALVQRLVAQAHATHLGALTRLACTMGSKEMWARVVTLIRESPESSRDVVVAAPWNDLPEEVRNVAAELHPVIGAAQGRHDRMLGCISEEIAVVFFAALDPRVWDALDAETQRRWLQALGRDAYLAVRSLGPRPEFLSRAMLNADLLRAARRYIDDDAALRRTLLPVALRTLSPSAAHTLIAAMPTPPSDPGAFFIIASGHADPFRVDPEDARTTLHTRANLARAVALQCSANRAIDIGDRCAALQNALHKQAWDNLTPILPLLDDDARAALSPHLDDMVECLARPDRQMEMRQALARLESLPPEVAIPTSVALNHQASWDALSVAEAIASALRAHGDVFMAIVDALADNKLRKALLPPPHHAAQADALRDVARDDPLSARHLALALRGQKWRAALHALLTAPPSANAVWQALEDDARRAIFAEINAANRTDDPMIARDPIIALALAAMQSDDMNLRNAGSVALAARADVLRTMWGALPHDVQQRLREIPALADLSNSAPPANRGMLRR